MSPSLKRLYLVMLILLPGCVERPDPVVVTGRLFWLDVLGAEDLALCVPDEHGAVLALEWGHKVSEAANDADNTVAAHTYADDDQVAGVGDEVRLTVQRSYPERGENLDGPVKVARVREVELVRDLVPPDWDCGEAGVVGPNDDAFWAAQPLAGG